MRARGWQDDGRAGDAGRRSRRCSQPNAVAGCLAGSLAGVKYGSISKGAPPTAWRPCLRYRRPSRRRRGRLRRVWRHSAARSVGHRHAGPVGLAQRAAALTRSAPPPPPPATTRSLRLARSRLRCVRAAGWHRVPGRGGRRPLEWHTACCCSIGPHSCKGTLAGRCATGPFRDPATSALLSRPLGRERPVPIGWL